MCGRYASSRTPADLVDEFGIVDASRAETLVADYNVAPSKPVYAVLERARDARSRDDHSNRRSVRQLRTLTWGLIPSWATDASIGTRLINARVETLSEKPAFKKAYQARRCLLPADGYFEWYSTSEPTKSGKPVKQPYFIHAADGSVLAMAGLYEIWRDPSKSDADADRFRWTAVVLTTTATDDLGRIHERMPVLVTSDRWDAWLDPHLADEGISSLLTPAAPGLLEAYPVSTAVNNARNNGAELIEPLEAQ